MAEPADKKPLSTMPADLVAAIEAVLARTFDGLDLPAEALDLGLPEEVLRSLRDRLVELRDVAGRAGAG